MGATVEDRVALWLSAHPNSTAEQVARGVSARNQSVREVLSGPLFGFTVQNGAVLYRLRSTPPGAPGRAGTGKETDKQFLARVLSDGEWHSLNQILARSRQERGCGLTVHSRAANLRADGFVIEHKKDGERGDGSWYRLVGSAAGCPGHTETAPPSGVDAASAVEPNSGQLTLTGGAFLKREAA